MLHLVPYTEPAPPETQQLLSDLFKNSETKEEGILRVVALVSKISDRVLDDRDVLQLYAQTLSDLPEESIARGFAWSLKLDTFFPSPARVRELAGAPSESDLAQDALAWLLSYIRNFGVDGAPKRIGREGPGEDGRVRRVGMVEQAPQVPVLLSKTLAILGAGVARTGLEMLRTHPSLAHWEQDAGMEPVWVSEKIELRFKAAFARARLSSGAIEGVRAGKVTAMRAGGD